MGGHITIIITPIHKNCSGTSDICLTERTVFEVDLKTASEFIEKMGFIEVVELTRYTGPKTGSCFMITNKLSGDQY